jgi:hypothetical protein
MAVSKIQQVTNNSDSNYCKMPDGTLLQWGFKLMPSNGTTSLIFHTPFHDISAVVANFSFHDKANAAGDIGALKIFNLTVAKADVTVGGNMPTGTGWGNVGIEWLAIGRWK